MREEENKGTGVPEGKACVSVACEETSYVWTSPPRNCGAPVGSPPMDYHGQYGLLLPRKRREMLYIPLCLCFQGQRLLIIDLQLHYKSGAEGNLPCCL